MVVVCPRTLPRGMRPSSNIASATSRGMGTTRGIIYQRGPGTIVLKERVLPETTPSFPEGNLKGNILNVERRVGVYGYLLEVLRHSP